MLHKDSEPVLRVNSTGSLNNLMLIKYYHTMGYQLEIYVHELTSPKEVDLENGIIKKVYSRLITRKFSKWDGSFKLKLAPGDYSIFVRSNNSYYGNLTDAQGNLSPAIVRNKKFAWITITLDYVSFH